MLRIQIAAITLLTLLALPLWAWSGEEHVPIGTEGYQRACLRVRSLFSESKDPAVIERLHLACGIVAERSKTANTREVVFTYSALAGDWSRLAADHTATPDELTSSRLGNLVVGYRQMTTIVINNYRHFYPASITSWRHDHESALESAVATSTISGIALAEHFEHALAIESFAQHYLQDSFASGHMGFNRLASSNATALAYHDHMSKVGRCVANENGEAWFTIGDDHLFDRDKHHRLLSPKSSEHVITASAASFSDFLESFVSGSKSADRWQKVWAMFPATFNDNLTRPGCTYSSGWTSLRSVGQPAPGVSSIEISSLNDYSIYRPGFTPGTPAPAARAWMIGWSHDTGGSINIGYRAIHTRIFAAIGDTVRQTGPHELYVDWGEAAQVGTSMLGLLTHEIGFGETFVYSQSSPVRNKPGYYWYSFNALSLRLFYGLRIEAGPVYIRAQVGEAYERRAGSHVSLGLGWVIP